MPSISLEKVLGNSVTSSNAVSFANSTLAYFSSGTLVCHRLQFDSEYAQVGKNDSVFFFTNQFSQNAQHGEMSANASSQSLESSANALVKNLSCLELSSDAKWVAVGESGHQPRVLLFRLNSRTPTFVHSISEHDFGVQCLSFSEDVQFLATLGNFFDGYLYVWKLGRKLELLGTNRCSNEIHGLVWCGHKFVTFGAKIIKIWQLEKSTRKFSLRGKRVVLGESYYSETFVQAHKWLDGVLLRSANNILLRLDLNSGSLSLVASKVRQFVVSGSQIVVWGHCDVVADYKDTVTSYAPINMETHKVFPVAQDQVLVCSDKIDLVHLSSQKTVPVVQSSRALAGIFMDSSTETCGLWSSDGDCHIITPRFDFQKVPRTLARVDEGNKVCAVTSLQGQMVFGDLFGYIYYGKRAYKAHDSRINGFSVVEYKEQKFLVTVGRDRAVNVFLESMGTLHLVQTQVLESGNPIQVLTFGNKIFALSSNRSVQVIQIDVSRPGKSGARLRKCRSLSLMATPVCMAIVQKQVFVTMFDKTVGVFCAEKLRHVQNIRFHKDTGSVLVENVCSLDAQHIVCSCRDKSVAIFNVMTGKCVGSWQAHVSLVVGLAVYNGKVISASNDGCVFVWGQEALNQAKKTTKASSVVDVRPIKFESVESEDSDDSQESRFGASSESSENCDHMDKPAVVVESANVSAYHGNSDIGSAEKPGCEKGTETETKTKKEIEKEIENQSEKQFENSPKKAHAHAHVAVVSDTVKSQSADEFVEELCGSLAKLQTMVERRELTEAQMGRVRESSRFLAKDAILQQYSQEFVDRLSEKLAPLLSTNSSK